MLYPKIKEISSSSLYTDRFKGINRGLRSGDGEFYDTKNMTNDFYPVLSSRKKRGVVTKLNDPVGMAVKDGLIYADGSDLYYNGNKVEGVVLSTLYDNCPKRFVGMGAYLLVFPDNIYVNTVDLTDFGSMEMSFEADDEVSFTLSNADGTAYDMPTVSKTAPDDAKNGDLWIDTSGDIHILKQYSENLSLWAEVASCYVRIETNGIGLNVKEGDGLRISGIRYDGENESLKAQAEALNGTRTVKARGDNFIVITGIIDEVFTQMGGVKAERKVPKADFIIECQNRLWGCYYGIDEGKTVNEIFCSKLGDFRNWEVYAGISTDSYRASVGTDGVWTGAVSYLGYPLFFKENHVHKVYVSSSGAHQIVTNKVDGVQKGSENSLAVVSDTLLYKSPSGVNIFDGTQAHKISEAFGNERFFEASAGGLGEKYYISMKNEKDQWSMFVYDIRKGLWVKEDNTKALFFSCLGDELYYVDEGTFEVKNINGSAGETEEDFEWEATFGTMGYEYSEKKYLSRFRFRMCLEEKGYMEVLIQYDSNGVWEKHGVIKGLGKNRSFTLPIIPRRCDHLDIKLKGKGDFTLYSFERVLERGSDI